MFRQQLRAIPATYSGIITPNAAPRSKPVPKLERRAIWGSMCESYSGNIVPLKAKHELENAKESGSMPKPKEQTPSNSDITTSEANIINVA
jgi:hypothetical protein